LWVRALDSWREVRWGVAGATLLPVLGRTLSGTSNPAELKGQASQHGVEATLRSQWQAEADRIQRFMTQSEVVSVEDAPF